MMASNEAVDFIDFSKKCLGCGMTKRKFEIPLSIYDEAVRCKLNWEERKVCSFSYRVCGWLNQFNLDAICDRKTIMFLRKKPCQYPMLFLS